MRTEAAVGYEGDLVRRARSGDTAAFERLLQIHGPRESAAARLIMGGAVAAEDPLQDAFLGAWRSLHGLRDPDRFGPWLHRLVVNACLNHRRSAWRFRRAANVGGVRAETYPGPEAVVVRQDAIDRALRSLSADQRAVLVLRYGSDLSGQEIAETLGVPAGTVRSRLHNAMAAMRTAVARDEAASGGDLSREHR